MLDNEERFALIEFLMSNVDERGDGPFQEFDFARGGKLVFTNNENQQVVFGNIDQLLEILKKAFMKGSEMAAQALE